MVRRPAEKSERYQAGTYTPAAQHTVRDLRLNIAKEGNGTTRTDPGHTKSLRETV